jgi:hypothetical protein
VGTYIAWGVNNNGWWGEGEIKFYIDGDDQFPTICGTGTEDYFGGAWNFEHPRGELWRPCEDDVQDRCAERKSRHRDRAASTRATAASLGRLAQLLLKSGFDAFLLEPRGSRRKLCLEVVHFMLNAHREQLFASSVKELPSIPKVRTVTRSGAFDRLEDSLEPKGILLAKLNALAQ